MGAKPIFFSAVVCLLISCTEKKIDRFVIDEVEIEYSVTDIEFKRRLESVFVYIEVVVENTGGSVAFFDPDSIAALLNGVESSEVYYSSLASSLPEVVELSAGEHVFNLYITFPLSEKRQNNEFQILRHGVSLPGNETRRE